MVDESLKKKLDPDNFTSMSSKMAAIVNYILDIHDSHSCLVKMFIKRKVVYAINVLGEKIVIGGIEDLNLNWTTLLLAAGLSAEEKDRACELFKSRLKIK